jgi:hypothetical protein
LSAFANRLVPVSRIDVLQGEIRFDPRRYARLGNDHACVQHVETGARSELQCGSTGWTVEMLRAAAAVAVTKAPHRNLAGALAIRRQAPAAHPGLA